MIDVQASGTSMLGEGLVRRFHSTGRSVDPRAEDRHAAEVQLLLPEEHVMFGKHGGVTGPLFSLLGRASHLGLDGLHFLPAGVNVEGLHQNSVFSLQGELCPPPPGRASAHGVLAPEN